MATVVPFDEIFPRRNLVPLTARLALLESEALANYLAARALRADLRAAIETPFGPQANILDQLLTDAEETHRYDADGDDAPAGSD